MTIFATNNKFTIGAPYLDVVRFDSDKRTAGATYCCTLSQCLHDTVRRAYSSLKLSAKNSMVYEYVVITNLNLVFSSLL